jgi:DNA polymerase-3 subunit alpha
VESLIKAGAFDSMGHSRKGLCLVFEPIVDRTLARRRERELGVLSLFGEAGVPGADGEAGDDGYHDERVPIPDLEFGKAQKLAYEKEMLGLYVSDHPLMGAEAALRTHAEASIAELRDLADGEVRWVGGVVTNLARRYTKKGDLMATFHLEDLESSIETWVFPRAMLEHGPLLADDAIVCVKARVDTRDDQPKLTCLELKRPELVLDGGPPVRIGLALASLNDSCVTRLKQLLVEHPGPSPVFLHLRAPGQADESAAKVLRLPQQFNVDARNGLLAEIRVLLGPQGVVG